LVIVSGPIVVNQRSADRANAKPTASWRGHAGAEMARFRRWEVATEAGWALRLSAAMDRAE
jgi:hypothetical protein